MTIYEQVRRETQQAAFVIRLATQPLEYAVPRVSTTRPTLPNGQCFIRMQDRKVRLVTPAFVKPQWIVSDRPTKDRGS